MSKKTMVIGLRPEYYYPGDLNQWSRSNTHYAANLGACFITNSLLKQFNADFVDSSRFDDIESLRKEYDTCILALATHLHPTRDISLYTNFVEKLEIKTVMLSAGITDYDEDIYFNYKLHASVFKMLEIVSERSKTIGVRGNYSAALLNRIGFNNVVAVGCPSMYWPSKENIIIHKKTIFERVLIPYHLTLAKYIPEFLEDKVLLGQDFQDEVIFTNNLENDIQLIKWLQNRFDTIESYSVMLRVVRKGGVFHREFNKWFDFIGKQDFVVGPRLHACLAALVQGVPTVMTPRDLRGKEIAEFYRLPTTTYEGLRSTPLEEIYKEADFTAFHEIYPSRYHNYISVLAENDLLHSLTDPSTSVLKQDNSDINVLHKIYSKWIRQLENNSGV